MRSFTLDNGDIGVPWEPGLMFSTFQSFKHFRKTGKWQSRDYTVRHIFAISNDHLIALINWIFDNWDSYPPVMLCFMFREAMLRGFVQDYTGLWK